MADSMDLVQQRVEENLQRHIQNARAWSCRTAQTSRYPDPHRAGCISPVMAPATECRRAGWCASPDRRYRIPDSPSQTG